MCASETRLYWVNKEQNTVRFRYLLVAPLLWVIGESTLRKDLVNIKNVLDNA